MSGFKAIAERAHDCACRGDLSGALGCIADAAANTWRHDPARGEVLSSLLLDEAALAIGRRSLPQEVAPRKRQAVIIVSSLAADSHPAHVVALLRRAEEDNVVTVLVSNIRDEEGRLAGGDAPTTSATRISPYPSPALGMRWIQQQLQELAPVRTYLVIEPDDAAAVAACQPELTGTLFFYHHRFSTFALGAQLPHATHVDCGVSAVHRCAEERVAESSPLFWPLPSPDLEMSGRSSIGFAGPLVTGCAGDLGDYEATDMLEPMPYSITYGRAVATILAATGGRHVHLGRLSEETLADIAERILQRGLNPARFLYRGGVRPTRYLLRFGVNLFMGGIPRTSLSTIHGAMAAGLPLLLHSNYRSALLTGEYDSYSGVRTWRTMDELTEQLAVCDAELLQRDSDRAIAAYGDALAPERFIEAVRAAHRGHRAPLPPKPPHRVDTAQNYHDRRRAYLDAGAPVLSVGNSARLLFEAARRRMAERIGAATLIGIEIKRDEPEGKLLRYHLDSARAGPTWIELRGWATSDTPITEIVVEHQGHTVGEFCLFTDRPDVVAAYPGTHLACGFTLNWAWLDDREADHRVKLRFFVGHEQVGAVEHRLIGALSPVAG